VKSSPLAEPMRGRDVAHALAFPGRQGQQGVRKLGFGVAPTAVAGRSERDVSRAPRKHTTFMSHDGSRGIPRGVENGGLLRQCQGEDVAPGNPKRPRLYEALAAPRQFDECDGIGNRVAALARAATPPPIASTDWLNSDRVCSLDT
jgi:hypothetical protein